jgi:hypothetical protein
MIIQEEIRSLLSLLKRDKRHFKTLQDAEAYCRGYLRMSCGQYTPEVTMSPSGEVTLTVKFNTAEVLIDEN